MEDLKPHSDRLDDIRLKWVQTYNAATDNDPRTAAMRSDIRWLVEQLEAVEAAFREATLGFIGYAFPEDDPEKIIGDVMSGFRQSGQLRCIASNPASEPDESWRSGLWRNRQ